MYCTIHTNCFLNKQVEQKHNQLLLKHYLICERNRHINEINMLKHEILKLQNCLNVLDNEHSITPNNKIFHFDFKFKNNQVAPIAVVCLSVFLLFICFAIEKTKCKTI